MSQPESSFSTSDPSVPSQPVVASRRLMLLPYFSSAFLFLSAILMIFAPLPLLYIYLKAGRKKSIIMFFTNALIVFLLSGFVSFSIYFVFVMTVSVSMGEFLLSKRSLETSVASTLLIMLLVSTGCLGIYSYFFQVNGYALIVDQVMVVVNALGQSLANRSTVDPMELEDLKSSLLMEFPSAIGIFCLYLIWINVLMLFRVKGSPLTQLLGTDGSYLQRWKAPDFLVWPTILFGALFIADLGLVSNVALNFFKFIMAIYALQGLSILGALFNSWKLKGLPRFIGFLFSLLLMLPVILSLGFFDLWFDFRSKFRQS